MYKYKFHDHVQINLSADTLCGEALDTVILRHSDATFITDVSVRDCNQILNKELEAVSYTHLTLPTNREV